MNPKWVIIGIIVLIFLAGSFVIYKISREDEEDGYSKENFQKPRKKSNSVHVSIYDQDMSAAMETMNQHGRSEI